MMQNITECSKKVWGNIIGLEYFLMDRVIFLYLIYPLLLETFKK